LIWFVMALARKNQIKVVERTIPQSDLAKATEVFLAGTAAEVTPVRQVGDQTFTPAAITEKLLRDYEALVRMPPEQVAAALGG
jgi:branched-chain amino acid aminotransferase